MKGYGEKDYSCSMPARKGRGIYLFNEISVYFLFWTGFEVDYTGDGDDDAGNDKAEEEFFCERKKMESER